MRTPHHRPQNNTPYLLYSSQPNKNLLVRCSNNNNNTNNNKTSIMAPPDRSQYEPIGESSQLPSSSNKRRLVVIVIVAAGVVVAGGFFLIPVLVRVVRQRLEQQQHAITVDITTKILHKLNKTIKGTILFPTDPNFVNASQVWSPNNNNAQLSCDANPPLAVVEAAHEKDVVLALPVLANLFVQHKVAFRIKSGGHSIPGWSSVPGGIILSLAKLNKVRVKKSSTSDGAAVAIVGPAATMKDMLQTTLPAGYGGVVGFCPGVAMGGFALGGGLGVQTRLHGLGLDNIVSARMVTANGSIVVASSKDDTDLFFALRGAGNNNFGVVTEMHYQLYRTPADRHGKELLSVMGLVPLDMIPQLNVKLGDMEHKIPRNWYIMYDGGLEETADGGATRALPLAFYYTGDMAVGKEYAKTHILSWFPADVANAFEIKTQSWYDWMMDSGNLEGNYVRAWTGFLSAGNNTMDVWTRIQDDALIKGCKYSPYLVVDVELLGGAVGDRASNETAFPFRNVLWFVSLLLIVPVEQGKSVFDNIVQHVDAEVWPKIEMYFDGAYLNYPMESLSNTEYPHLYWGGNLNRLREIKAKYDPNNVFRHPQSVPLP
jgi:Berberine and berberine like/FAD binding domain